MPFDESFHSNVIIDERGEDVTHRTKVTYHDPETGDVIDETATDITIRAYMEELSLEEKMATAGIIPKYDIRGYVKVGISVSIGDQILRYPDTANEKAYDIENIKEYGAYKELEMKRRED